MVRDLKAELELANSSAFLSDVLALFRWAVSERRRGHHILSESLTGERKVFLLPCLERVAPPDAMSQAEIQWSDEELQSLVDLASQSPATPTEALTRAVRRT